MNHFFPISPKQESIISFIKKIPREILFIILSASIVCLSIAVFISSYELGTHQSSPDDITWEKSDTSQEDKTNKNTKKDTSENFIYIDVSGSVVTPGMYKVKQSTRLSQAVEQAGGLSYEADKEYYYRNFNLAKTLTDQEKIYVPSYIEIQRGLFTEHTRILTYMPEENSDIVELDSDKSSVQQDETKISINTATAEKLESLPGVGPATATKIINNRPYESLEDIKTKKAVGESLFSKIQDMIQL